MKSMDIPMKSHEIHGDPWKSRAIPMISHEIHGDPCEIPCSPYEVPMKSDGSRELQGASRSGVHGAGLCCVSDRLAGHRDA